MAAKDSRSGRKARPVGTPATSRMRKLGCPACGYIARVSRRWIAAGLPFCPCGGRLIPEDAEDAALALSAAELAEHPAVIEWQRALSGAAKGQSWTAHKIMATARDANQIASEKVEKARRERAHRNQLVGLRRGAVDPLAAEPDDEWPF